MALSKILPASRDQSVDAANLIINGACVIDQRNGGSSITPTDGQFSADRWQVNVAQSSKLTIQQSTTAPTGFSNSLLVTSSSAYSVASSDYFYIRQNIEGYNFAHLEFGSANAKTFTLSFWVRSSLTGTFGGALNNGAGNRSYAFTYTILSADTWEYKTITVTGDTSGTWLTTNGKGLSLDIGLGVGSTYSGTAGSWASSLYLSATGATSVVGTSGATFYITGVCLNVGDQAPANYPHRSYGEELALCQRYYCKTYNYSDAPGTNTSSSSWVGGTMNQTTTTTWGATWDFPATMRASPATTTYLSNGTSGQLHWSSGAGNGNAAVTEFNKGSERVGFYHNGTASGLTAGYGAVIYGHIVADAEL